MIRREIIKAMREVEKTRHEWIVCNECNREVGSDPHGDVFVVQDFVHVRSIGGYGSAWPGDVVDANFDTYADCMRNFVRLFEIGPTYNEVEIG